MERGPLIVQGCVNLDSFSEPSTCFVRSSNSNDLRSVYFADLAYQRAHGASGTRDYECLTSLDICDIQQTLSCDNNGGYDNRQIEPHTKYAVNPARVARSVGDHGKVADEVHTRMAQSS